MTPIAAPEPASSSMLTRVAVGLSIAVHVAAVLWTLGYAGAGLYEPEPEAVPVSLVTPEEVAAATPEPPPLPEPKPDVSSLNLRPSSQPSPPLPAAPPPAPAAKPQQDAKSNPPPAPPAYAPPQPDISVRYQVDLGLQQMAATASQTAVPQKGTSDFDEASTRKADLDRSSIAAFRNRLRDCATLPAAIAPDDKVVIVLRATFTPEAKLAAAPALIEASASAKGPALMQAAVAALQTCQPFTSLPADKYGEWRVLDLRFTPQDFRRG